MIKTKTLSFRGKNVEVRQVDVDTWVDAEGTTYPAWMFDEGFCGVAPFETGKFDPFWKTACSPHDKAFNKMKNGYQNSETENLRAFSDFAKEVGIVMAQGAFAIVAGLPYIAVGGIGGLLRWAWLSRK